MWQLTFQTHTPVYDEGILTASELVNLDLVEIKKYLPKHSVLKIEIKGYVSFGET
jgi:hypothetical protein